MQVIQQMELETYKFGEFEIEVYVLYNHVAHVVEINLVNKPSIVLLFKFVFQHRYIFYHKFYVIFI